MEVTRRGFLAGLLGATVIAMVPKGAMAVEEIAPQTIDPWSIQAPPGTTYQWVRCSLLGEPDPANVEARLSNGWKFVAPAAHPGAPLSTAEKAIETGGLILMSKPTADHEASQLLERAEIEERFPGVKAARERGEMRSLSVADEVECPGCGLTLPVRRGEGHWEVECECGYAGCGSGAADAGDRDRR